MSKTGLRKIVLNEKTFLWRVGHYHLEAFTHSACVDKVVVYREHHKNSPLVLHFRLEDNHLLSAEGQKKDWFMDSGCLLTQKRVVNLNRPGVIAKLIAHYYGHDWHPGNSNKPFEVVDALKLLEVIELPEGMG